MGNKVLVEFDMDNVLKNVCNIYCSHREDCSCKNNVQKVIKCMLDNDRIDFKFTKFKPGDTIYIVIGRNMIAIRTVKSIVFQDNIIHYSTGNGSDIYPEGCCFGSLGEAQDECSKRNKGEKK